MFVPISHVYNLLNWLTTDILGNPENLQLNMQTHIISFSHNNATRLFIIHLC